LLRSDTVDLSPINTKKAFIVAAIDKEIRLSFTKRIRETLPKEYHKLIAEGKFKDTPDFKYNLDCENVSLDFGLFAHSSQLHRSLPKAVKYLTLFASELQRLIFNL
jgi:hypothetical protein